MPDEKTAYVMPDHLRGGLSAEHLDALRDPTDDLAQQAIERRRSASMSAYPLPPEVVAHAREWNAKWDAMSVDEQQEWHRNLAAAIKADSCASDDSGTTP